MIIIFKSSSVRQLRLGCKFRTFSTDIRAEWCRKLGVSTNASQEDIKHQYLSQIKKWHPDLFATKPMQEQEEARRKFQEIREAYEALTTQPEGEEAKKKPEMKMAETHTKTQTMNKKATYYAWSQVHTWNKSNSTTNNNNEGRTKYSAPSFVYRLIYPSWALLEEAFRHLKWLHTTVFFIMSYVLLRYLYKVRYDKEKTFGLPANVLPKKVLQHEAESVSGQEFQDFLHPLLVVENHCQYFLDYYLISKENDPIKSQTIH
ncbi:hypothetical protein RFI_13222 [Reticulomyxa filosa]|uniref:J domain-containing protein n=1 Tax=Reticulomyxa filosa TaxID=46433 RepID=X6NDX7_RETFI|nr:hypothetical protein RFI_13222 [Reticulomyxa filosa]|eukprot:ETO23934.1 hypothetical protein RFI_13222 [Reticulomyxa filosa]